VRDRQRLSAPGRTVLQPVNPDGTSGSRRTALQPRRRRGVRCAVTYVPACEYERRVTRAGVARARRKRRRQATGTVVVVVGGAVVVVGGGAVVVVADGDVVVDVVTGGFALPGSETCPGRVTVGGRAAVASLEATSVVAAMRAAVPKAMKAVTAAPWRMERV
jgi:hypothetical protein